MSRHQPLSADEVADRGGNANPAEQLRGLRCSRCRAWRPLSFTEEPDDDGGRTWRPTCDECLATFGDGDGTAYPVRCDRCTRAIAVFVVAETSARLCSQCSDSLTAPQLLR